LYCCRTLYIKKSVYLDVLVKAVKELPGANKLSDLQCRSFALKFYTYDRLKNLIDRMSIEMFLLEPLRIY
ncbi:MAG: hypothetical protein LUJ25_02460, partial [Firmicutes bacterium]|nr:hypothetical protein [Bacillota bacterium]